MKLIKKPTVQKEFYNLYRDGVSQSFINKFLTCKKQCRLEYIEGWTNKKEPMSFTYGKLIHWVLSKCYEVGEIPTYSAIKSYIIEYESKFLSETIASDMTQKEMFLGLAEMIIPLYFTKYKEDFESEMIRNEANFKVTDLFLQHTEWYKQNRAIPVAGRTDGGLLKDNDLWVLDHKCLSVIDEALDETLTKDTQVMLYLWAMRKLHPELNIKGFKYNIVRRPSHKITLKDSTIKSFCERVIKDISSRMDEFFIRITIPISGKEIDEWEQSFLIPVLCEIEEWANKGYYGLLNPNQLITKYGHCSMFDIIVRNDYTNFYQRSTPFSELEL